MAPTARHAAWLYGVAASAYVLDRLTKLWAESVLADRSPIELVPGVVQLNYTENPGGAFGLFGGTPWLFATATLLVCAVIVVASRSVGRPLLAVALGLVLGGALGNLTDRIVRGPGIGGEVVDFIDVHVWPVFNVADSAIVVGAVLIGLSGAWPRSGEPRRVDG